MSVLVSVLVSGVWGTRAGLPCNRPPRISIPRAAAERAKCVGVSSRYCPPGVPSGRNPSVPSGDPDEFSPLAHRRPAPGRAEPVWVRPREPSSFRTSIRGLWRCDRAKCIADGWVLRSKSPARRTRLRRWPRSRVPSGGRGMLLSGPDPIEWAKSSQSRTGAVCVSPARGAQKPSLPVHPAIPVPLPRAPRAPRAPRNLRAPPARRTARLQMRSRAVRLGYCMVLRFGDLRSCASHGPAGQESDGCQAAWRTNCTSRLIVTSLPSVKPPASSAAFQFTPNSVRSIFVVASAPNLTWP